MRNLVLGFVLLLSSAHVGFAFEVSCEPQNPLDFPKPATTGCASVPVGTILPFAGITPPVGYIIADGSAVDRIIYADLFLVIGTTYGAGNGSTTFNLPDLRGRAAIGEGSGPGLSDRYIGQALGEESHALTVAELPSHTHGVFDPGHRHANNAAANIHSGCGALGCGAASIMTPGAATFSDATTGISILPTGSGQRHNTMPPSLVIKHIIKY